MPSRSNLLKEEKERELGSEYRLNKNHDRDHGDDEGKHKRLFWNYTCILKAISPTSSIDPFDKVQKLEGKAEGKNEGHVSTY